MGVLLAKPSVPLSPWVRRYTLLSAHVGRGWVHLPLPARSDCFLEFYLLDRYRIVTVATGGMHVTPGAVVVGPHTRRLEDLVYTGDLLVFCVEFTAVGLRGLTGLSPREIADAAVEASMIFGTGIRGLHDELLACGRQMSGMVERMEAFLLRRLARTKSVSQVEMTGAIARMLERSGGTTEMLTLAHRFDRSTRQVERLFQEHVGVSPKVFAKLQRLNRALRMKEAKSDLSWSDVAAACGYFDQAHLGSDFRTMTGETPVRFAALSVAGRTVWQSRPAEPSRQDVAFFLSEAETPFLDSKA